VGEGMKRSMIIVLVLICFCNVSLAKNECCEKWKRGILDGKYQAWTNAGIRKQLSIEYCPECGEPLGYAREVEIMHKDSLLLGLIMVKEAEPKAENYYFPTPKKITSTLWEHLCEIAGDPLAK